MPYCIQRHQPDVSVYSWHTGLESNKKLASLSNNRGELCQTAWASHQTCEIAGCACARNAGNVFPTTDFKGNRHASRHVRDARVVIHVGTADAQWRGKRSRHSGRMLNPHISVSGKRPMWRVEVWTKLRHFKLYFYKNINITLSQVYFQQHNSK